MDIRSRISADLKDAMKAKDAERLSTLRLITAAIKDREIAARGDGEDTNLGEDVILSILGKMVKQRQDSARQYEEGGRLELAAKELVEVGVIEDYLPRQLDEAETTAALTAAIETVGATSIRDMGKVMAELKSHYTGQMDFTRVGGLVKARLG